MLNSLFSYICFPTNNSSFLKYLHSSLLIGFVFILALFLNSCDQATNSQPVYNPKSITRWQVDISSGKKLNKVFEEIYNKNEKLSSLNLYNNGNLEVKSVYEYADNKSIEHKEYLTPNGEHKSSEKIVNTTTTYEDNAKLVVKEVYAENGTLVSTTNITYDKNGNISKIKTVSKDVSQAKTVDYSNIYANNGALTGRTVVQINETNEIEEYKQDMIPPNNSNNTLIIRLLRKVGDKETLIKYSILKFSPITSRVIAESVYDPNDVLLERYVQEYVFF